MRRNAYTRPEYQSFGMAALRGWRIYIYINGADDGRVDFFFTRFIVHYVINGRVSKVTI